MFFESPRRVAETLADLAAVLGSREAAIARELTKFFETVRRGPLPDLAAAFAGGAARRARLVVLVGPAGEEAADVREEIDDARLGKALETLSVKDAAAWSRPRPASPGERSTHGRSNFRARDR